MKKNRLIPFIALVFILIIACACPASGSALNWPGANPTPTPAAQSQSTSPGGVRLAFITLPTDGSQVHVGIPLLVSARALAPAPITRLELWVGDQVVNAAEPAEGSTPNSFSAFWNWTPPAAGVYMLMARSLDAGPGSWVSNIVQVNAVQALPTVIPTIPANMTRVPLVNGKLQVTSIAPLPPGFNIGENMPAQIITPTLSPNLPPRPPFLKKEGAFNVSLKPMDLPMSPTISAAVGNCSVTITIKDPQLFGKVYSLQRADPFSPGYGWIADIPSTGGETTYIDQTAKDPGEYHYYVIANPSISTSMSNIGGATMGADCYQGWRGVVYAEVKMVPAAAMEYAYCYLRYNGGPFNRLPAVDGTFIPPMSAEEFNAWAQTAGIQGVGVQGYDLVPFLPSLAGAGAEKFSLDANCMAWQGGKLYTLGIGSADINVLDFNALYHLKGTGFDIYLRFSNKPMDLTKPGTQAVLQSPSNLQATGNPQDCAAAGVGTLEQCMSAISYHYVALSWKWTPGGCWPGTDCIPISEPDGFRVYRADYPKPSLMTELHNGQLRHMFLPYPPEAAPASASPEDIAKAKALNSHCFTVVAFKGSMIESHPSNQVCLPHVEHATGLTQVTLDPAKLDLREISDYHSQSSNSAGEDSVYDTYMNDYVSNGQLVTGHFFRFGADDDYNRRVIFGLAAFDLTPYIGKQVISAHLDSPIVNSQVEVQMNDGDDEYVGNQTCIRSVDILDDVYVSGLDSYAPKVVQYKPFSPKLDVTEAVQAWLDGSRPNHGFVYWPDLVWGNENAWDECTTISGPLKLNLVLSNK